MIRTFTLILNEKFLNSALTQTLFKKTDAIYYPNIDKILNQRYKNFINPN